MALMFRLYDSLGNNPGSMLSFSTNGKDYSAFGCYNAIIPQFMYPYCIKSGIITQKNTPLIENSSNMNHIPSIASLLFEFSKGVCQGRVDGSILLLIEEPAHLSLVDLLAFPFIKGLKLFAVTT